MSLSTRKRDSRLRSRLRLAPASEQPDATHFEGSLSQSGFLLVGLDLTGWALREALDISDDGRTIVGWGVNPSGYNEGWIATIPEPTTALLLATGLAGLAARRRRLFR